MISLFGLCAAIGLLMLIFERGAKYSSPAPSMYRTSGNGWIFVIVGIIGVIFVSLLP